MFFVFGPSGQMYRGGPENLARITSARRVNRPQALRTRGTDEAPPFSLESLLPGGAHPSGAAETAGATAPTGSANLRAHDAVSAYAQTGHPTPATRQPLSRVRDVMTPRSLTVQPDTIVNHAWQQLAEHGVAQAPVVDALGLQLLGAGLQGLALGFQGLEGLDVEEGLGIFAGLQALDGGAEVFAQEKNI